MCRLLAELTNTHLGIMRETIKRLESRSGLPAEDIRLTSDIHAKIHMKVRALGLDPHDTQPKELYVGLQNMAALHERFLRKKYGLEKVASPESLPKDIDFIYSRLRFNRRSWGLKGATIKRLMKNNPPKKVGKLIGYRSTASLVKREDPELLLLLCSHLESATWQEKLNKELKKIHAVDFEEKLIDVKPLVGKRYEKVAPLLTDAKNTMVFGLPLSGSIFVAQPHGTARQGMTLLALMMAMKETFTNQYLHSQLKHHQLHGDFGVQVYEAFRHKKQKTASLAGHIFNWDILHRHYGTAGHEEHSVYLQPHLQTEDLAYRRVEEVLYRAEPALHFWHEIDYVGINIQGSLLSMNLLDVLTNLVNDIGFTNKLSGHLQQAVWDELLLRYMRHRPISRAVTAKFEPHRYVINDVVSTEFA